MKTIFKLTEEDFNAIAEGYIDRRLTSDEISLAQDKFSIDDWSEIVEMWLDVYINKGDK